VLVSSTVKDLTAGSGLVFEDRGEHELKGVLDRWYQYQVVGYGEWNKASCRARMHYREVVSGVRGRWCRCRS
jgi:hypothetical protein